MQPASRRTLRVALSATPPLLAHGLRSLLEDERTEVSIIVEPVCDTYDVAIRTAGAPVVAADVVVELADHGGGPGGGTAWTSSGGRRLPDLAAVLAFVRGLSGVPQGTATIGSAER